MRSLLVESHLLLIRLELLMLFGKLNSIRELVLRSKVEGNEKRRGLTVEGICHAIDMACVFYPKHVLCLQRTAVTVLLLRRYGWNAEMVVGAQMMPFRSHAWSELDGTVVGDKPYLRDIYHELERC
ncbi:lasso peptide biosynthesis B2 protein [Tunturiibacter gelidiferens]|uniref:lasso peptide biosynthesis B2 protein n=1 Tax=Tunturiibacter gelidiferens TaxID=3069689 RepID=UPI0033404CE7